MKLAPRFNQLFERNAPRLIIFLADTFIAFLSLFIAYLLRFNFAVPPTEFHTFIYVFPFMIGIRILGFLIFRIYAGLIRFTGTRDTLRILLTLLAGSIVVIASNGLSYAVTQKFLVPFSIIIIEFLLTVFLMITGRLVIKVAYQEMNNPSRERLGAIIYGAGNAGLIAKRTLDRDRGTRYKIVAFVDDDPKKAGKKLEGIPIYSAGKLEEIQQHHSIKDLIISIQNISPTRKQQIIESCLGLNIRVLNVPPVRSWINGELSFKQIRKINIEDLLGRDPIRLDMDKLQRDITGKTILVTGAAGSIGSELVRQILLFHPRQLVMVDIAESPLYELELELKDNQFETRSRIETVIGDIRNFERMRNVFQTFRPDVVYHAAAYKHVPVMEHNPSESILNNVLGTKILADLANEFAVKKFIMVSTDKAVNPTNIMGATKRIAEIYAQALGTRSRTKFITTRFGNVLGSNGSVIPRFRKQIEKGIPLTVTHPEVTRYFMTISEACQLVLEASVMGNGGEIFIFDMGKSVRIADLAKKMIKLSGLELGKDIQIVYSGLRPGEKLYEELLATEENTVPTHHAKIMIARVKEYDYNLIADDIRELIALFDTQDNHAIVRKMKEIVPEFISKNSEYEKLDAN